MKQVAQKKTYKQFDAGSNVQVSLADVDCTKVDGKKLTLIIVEVVHQKVDGTSMYQLASQTGVL